MHPTALHKGSRSHAVPWGPVREARVSSCLALLILQPASLSQVWDPNCFLSSSSCSPTCQHMALGDDSFTHSFMKAGLLPTGSIHTHSTVHVKGHSCGSSCPSPAKSFSTENLSAASGPSYPLYMQRRGKVKAGLECVWAYSPVAASPWMYPADDGTGVHGEVLEEESWALPML